MVFGGRSPTETRNGMRTGDPSHIIEIGALYGTSKFFRATCGNKLTDIDFDFLPTMEGDCSQIFPGLYANSGPSVSKAKVIKSDILRILYYNARSLLPKLDELSATVEAHNFPDVICIVESWLGHDVKDQNRHGGGILIYAKDTYITSVLPCAPTDLEIITICVQSGNCKACLSLFYRPPSSSSVIFDTFCKYFESLNTAQYSNFILLGDFNINFVSSSHPLCNIMSTYCLTQIVTECSYTCTSQWQQIHN